MIDMIYNLFLGMLGVNMVIIGVVVTIVPIVMLVKQRGVTHIISILYIVAGPLLIYFGIYLARKYLFHNS